VSRPSKTIDETAARTSTHDDDSFNKSKDIQEPCENKLSFRNCSDRRTHEYAAKLHISPRIIIVMPVHHNGCCKRNEEMVSIGGTRRSQVAGESH